VPVGAVFPAGTLVRNTGKIIRRVENPPGRFEQSDYEVVFAVDGELPVIISEICFSKVILYLIITI
jgi:hypothetical protein